MGGETNSSRLLEIRAPLSPERRVITPGTVTLKPLVDRGAPKRHRSTELPLFVYISQHLDTRRSWIGLVDCPLVSLQTGRRPNSFEP